MEFEFTVIDNRTGMYPDCETIALTEEWAKCLIYCDIDCFAITEEGQLVLIDDCNNIAYPPEDRFTVTIDPESLRPQGEWLLEAHDERANCRWNVTAECSECCDERNEIWAGFFPNVPSYLAKEVALQDAKSVKLPNFCSNCGAKMKP